MSSGYVEEIHIRLRDELERRGLSLAEASRAIGETTSQGLRDVCSGRKRATAELVARLAVTGIDVLYVLTGQRFQGVTDQSKLPSTATLPNEPELTDQAATAGQVPPRPALSRREQALLANYRGSDEEGRRAMEATASALAHRDSAKPQRNGGE